MHNTPQLCWRKAVRPVSYAVHTDPDFLEGYKFFRDDHVDHDLYNKGAVLSQAPSDQIRRVRTYLLTRINQTAFELFTGCSDIDALRSYPSQFF
jgi:hypothetical protein